MLYLILSRIRGGKTTHIHNLIGQFADAGKKVTLIVPEQYSFTTERMMLERMGAAKLADIDIVSFTSLAEDFAPPCPSGRRRLDDAGRAALMGIALDTVRDRLTVYSRHTESPSLITELVILENELRTCAVSTEEFRNAANAMEDCMLKRKIGDICLALDAYSALTAQSRYDDRDLLTLLAKSIPHSDYFKGRLVFIDAFRGFTQQEYNVIEGMLGTASAVYVTLCTDNLNNCDDETDIFAHTKRTAVKLKGIAARCGVPVAKPQYLSERSKYNNFPPDMRIYNREELAALERELFSPEAQPYEEESPAITVCCAPDIYSECEYIACTAKKLIREQGYRCRDIAVLARSSTAYEAPLRSALRKCSVGVFEDKRQSVKDSALICFAESAVDIAAGGFSTQRIMRYLKSGIAGVDIEEISELENYCRMWQINGSHWLDEWTSHPRGFGEEMNEQDEQTLSRINSLRERVLSPLKSFRSKLENATGEAAARALFSLLTDTNARDNLKQLAVALDAAGDTSAALEQERIWSCLVDLLDSIETVAGGRVIGAKGLRDIFSLMLSVQTVGTIPQGLDEIVIGSADRVRTGSPKVVFVAGANYGVLPALPASGAALSDSDRRRLLELGIEMGDFGEYEIAQEKLIAYSALCCASDRLYVTYPKRDMQGASLLPSELVGRICELFPKCVKTDYAEQDGMLFVEGHECAFEQLAREKRSGTPLYAALCDCFSSNPDYSGRLAALERAAHGREFRLDKPETARALFGKNLNLSASKVEMFYKCKFSYFCRYGINARPALIAKMDPMQRGNVIHYVLEKLLSKYPGDSLINLGAEARLAEIERLMAVYLEDMLAGEGKDERFMANYHKLAVTVSEVASRLAAEFAVSSFRPIDFELPVGGSSEGIEAYRVEDGEGGTVTLFGKIDRVDIADEGGKRYVRIVDYKSSAKAFSVSDVMQGLNMQMLIYLFAVWKNGTARYGETVPAGILYFPAKVPPVSLGRYASSQEIIAEQTKKCRMSGIILDSSDVITAMDKTGKGTYVPASFKKDGSTDGSLIRLKQLLKLKERADGLLAGMALSLRGGDISAVPAYGANYKNVCDNCDYKTVCGYENGIEMRELHDMKPADALASLDNEEVSDNAEVD